MSSKWCYGVLQTILRPCEMLGQTFLQKKEPKAALRSLTRGLDAPCEVEEERVGILLLPRAGA